MRVAALYDIHGNLPALEAVLQELRREAVDLVVIGGDVLPGPMPCETLARVLDLDWPTVFIRGNGDREVLAERREPGSSGVPEAFQAVMRWTARQLRPDDEQVLAGWPLTCRLTIDGLGEVLFCHATPRNDTDIVTRRTPEDRLVPLFDGLGAALVVCGHTHMQFDRLLGTTRVVNAGSVGMPFGPPGAYWLMLGPDVQLRHTPYDLDAAAARIRATAYPQAEAFAAQHVLQPPTEDTMLDALGRSELP